MYRKKSEIIEQIQSYHRQVAALYYEIYKKTENDEIKSLLFDLYNLEKEREKYLDRHKIIARAINCWLDFPCERLSNQIDECLKHNFGPRSKVKMEDLLKLELHFDDCLIKLYNILAVENELTETTANIFYYMLRKTGKEKELLANMFYKSANHISGNRIRV
jgi:hypothetical protein